MLFKPKRAGGDPSGPAAKTAHEKRGRAPAGRPAGPLRYRCAVFFVLFCKRDPALLSNRATLGATITQEMNFAL